MSGFKPVWNALEGKFDYVLAPFSVIEQTITASTSSVVDTQPLASFTAATFYFKIVRVSDGKSRTFSLDVNNNDGDVRDTIYKKLGQNMSVLVDTGVSGLNYELTITNNEASDVAVTYLKTTI